MYGWITSANGSLDFFKSEFVVGTAFSVDRTYLEEQFASGDEVTLDCIQISKFFRLRLY